MASSAEAVAVPISVVPVAVSVAIPAVVVSEFVFVVGMRSAVVSDVGDEETTRVIGKIQGRFLLLSQSLPTFSPRKRILISSSGLESVKKPIGPMN